MSRFPAAASRPNRPSVEEEQRRVVVVVVSIASSFPRCVADEGGSRRLSPKMRIKSGAITRIEIFVSATTAGVATVAPLSPLEPRPGVSSPHDWKLEARLGDDHPRQHHHHHRHRAVVSNRSVCGAPVSADDFYNPFDQRWPPSSKGAGRGLAWRSVPIAAGQTTISPFYPIKSK